MQNLFNYNGTIGRKQYFIKQAIFLVVFLLIFTVYLSLVSLLPKDAKETVALNIALIGSLVLMLGVTIIYIIASLFLVMKRARDTGSFVLWITIAILVPFGYIIVGLIPPATKQK